MATVVDKGVGAPGKRWLVRYREPGGRSARQREKSFDRKKDAVDFATKMENDKRENSYVDPSAGKVSVRRYAADWLALKPMAAGTEESYERIMRLHVLPQLGKKTISQVTAADVEELYALWRRQGAMPNTIDSRRIALSGILSHAVRHKRIRENPAKQAEKPANPIMQVDERALPSFDEISALAKEIGPRLEPAVWLMACCGLRIGESLGVFPEDIFDGTLRCRRQVVRIKNSSGKYVALYAPLKHRKEGEWRDIPAPSTLEPLAERLPIRNQAGGMIYPDLFRKSWDRALKRLGLPGYNPHDLRHKWATVTLSNGVPIHEVSRWMGHSSIKITVDRYGHLTLDGSERCREVIEATFGVHMLSGFPAPRELGAELVLA
ncbi:site-specific integrase [Streptomyces tubercidicus]|uniref:Site-specific integrase n=1 Tax=Streptomyces tubercidicus TaxID=47759 RepID=A0A640UYA5_9ACTN|nr:site-specific integrase [Streptomyces tubercidicus]